MNVHGFPVRAYRWIVFLLAAGYLIYQATTASYEGPGGPFRYLTIWALVASAYSAARMLGYSEGYSTGTYNATASVAAVLNAMVVFLYWKLYFEDPSLVNGGNAPVWHQEYYLHLAGPILQWLDAIFILGAFRRPFATLTWLAIVIASYVAWAELFVQRYNDRPVGTVTSGLPYPFLNDMELPARAQFYGLNFAVAIGFMVAFTILAMIFRPSRR